MVCEGRPGLMSIFESVGSDELSVIVGVMLENDAIWFPYRY